MENVEQLNEDLVSKQLAEIRAIQQTNEMIANVPTEFEVAGRTIQIKSKSIRQMVRIDKAILELHKVSFTDRAEERMDVEAQVDAAIKRNELIYQKMTECLFFIINDIYTSSNGKEPEFSLEWIEENISIAPGSVGEQILDAYNQKSSSESVLKKMLMSRKF